MRSSMSRALGGDDLGVLGDEVALGVDVGLFAGVDVEVPDFGLGSMGMGILGVMGSPTVPNTNISGSGGNGGFGMGGLPVAFAESSTGKKRKGPMREGAPGQRSKRVARGAHGADKHTSHFITSSMEGAGGVGELPLHRREAAVDHHAVGHLAGREQDQQRQDQAAPPSAPENTGRWDTAEHELFLQGLKLYGKGWKKIAELIKTRTVVQIRTHAQKYFQKLDRAERGGGGGKGLAQVGKGRKGVGKQKHGTRGAKGAEARSAGVAPLLKPYLNLPGVSGSLEVGLYKFLSPLVVDGKPPTELQAAMQRRINEAVSSEDEETKVSGVLRDVSVAVAAHEVTEVPQWYSRGLGVEHLIDQAENMDWAQDIGTGVENVKEEPPRSEQSVRYKTNGRPVASTPSSHKRVLTKDGGADHNSSVGRSSRTGTGGGVKTSMGFVSPPSAVSRVGFGVGSEHDEFLAPGSDYGLLDGLHADVLYMEQAHLDSVLATGLNSQPRFL